MFKKKISTEAHSQAIWTEHRNLAILRHMVYEHMYTSVYAPCLPTEF